MQGSGFSVRLDKDSSVGRSVHWPQLHCLYAGIPHLAAVYLDLHSTAARGSAHSAVQYHSSDVGEQPHVSDSQP